MNNPIIVHRSKFALLIVFLMQSACSQVVDENDVQTAIAQTIVAQPSATLPILEESPDVTSTAVNSSASTLQSTLTDTSAPIDTVTPVPSLTPEPTLTIEPSPTPDTRVFVGSVREYLCRKTDLPDEYGIPPGDMGETPHTNEEYIAGYGGGDPQRIEEARRRVEEWERIDSWTIQYVLYDAFGLGNEQALSGVPFHETPAFLTCQIVRYGTIAGPSLQISSWAAEFLGEVNKVEIPLDETIGDESRLYQSITTEYVGTGSVKHILNFRYHNIGVYIRTYENTQDADHTFAVDIARNEFERIKTMPLVEAPTAVP